MLAELTFLHRDNRSERLLWGADNLGQLRAETRETEGRHSGACFGLELPFVGSKVSGIASHPCWSELCLSSQFALLPPITCLVISSGCSSRFRSGGQRHLSYFVFCTTDSFNNVEQCRDNKNRDSAGSRYSPDDCRAHHLARHSARTRCGPKWHAAQEERQGGHQNRAQAQLGAFQSGFDERLALFLMLQFGELHDQDGVLSGESDEHDQANLCVNIVLKGEACKSTKIQGEESSKDGYWHANEHTERQSPALVKRRKNQKTEKG